MNLEDHSIIAWLLKNGMKNEKGDPITFKNHMFQYDIYRDFHPNQVSMKGAQIGYTVLEILKAFFIAKTMGIDIIFTQPTDTDVTVFSAGKVNRIIKHNPVLQECVKEKDSVEQKSVGDSMIYYRGCFDKETEVLTVEGWKKYDEVSIGDKLPTLSLEDGCVYTQEILDLSVFEVDEELVKIKNRAVDMLLTKDHRCVVNKRNSKNEYNLKIKRAHKITRHSNIPKIWKGEASGYNSFAEVIGMVIADGSYWKERYKNKFVKKDGTKSNKVWEYDRVCIIQKKYKDYIRKILSDSGIKYYEKKRKTGVVSFELSREASKKIREVTHNKKLTFDVVNRFKGSLTSLYRGLMMGDGAWNDVYFYQSDYITTSAFQYLCVLLGKATKYTVKKQYRKDGGRYKDAYSTTIGHSRSATKFDISSVAYKGIVWCPTTKNGTVFIRRNGTVSVTGQTFSKKAAISVTADLLIHDEVDFSDQDVIGDYESRLQHSKYKWKWYFGHPSTAGTGVHHYWELSDKRHWFVKCTHCNTWQYLSFPESICPERKIYQCKQCKKEITDKDRDSGQWVKKYQQREYHGYLVSLLMAPWMPASKILQYKEEKTEEYFCNRVLGLPYIGSGNKVAESTILQNLTSRPNPQDGNVVIGIDTGINLDYVVGNERGIFHYGTTKKYEDIEAMLKRWKNSIAVFDQGGDLIGSREMREKYPGRVFLCHYRQDRKTMQLIKWGEKEERGNVVVDRNRMLQLCIDEFEKKKMNIFGTRKDWWGFWLHWNAIFRVKEEDSLGVSVYKWKRSGADHFCHAYLYFRVGISKFANAEGEIFSADRPDIDNIIKR